MALSPNAAINPYAPPKARLEEPARGTAWRDGKLVQFKHADSLPDRCVLCDADAHGERVGRRLYYSPLAWRVGAFAAPFAMLAAGFILDWELLVELFWPMVLVVFVANFFVRRSLKVELGICARHRRIRAVLQVLSFLSMAVVVLGLVLLVKFHSYADLVISSGWNLSLAGIIALFVLALVQGFTGVQSVTLKRVKDDAAWLEGTGKAFREGLPERTG